LSVEEKSRVAAHPKVCGFCHYRAEAIRAVLIEHGSIDAPAVVRLSKIFSQRFLCLGWAIRSKVERFSKFELKDPIEIMAVATYLMRLSNWAAPRTGQRSRSGDPYFVIEYVLGPANNSLPASSELPDR